MEQNQVIRNILYNWSRTLNIDGQSGESIVTVHDIDCLTKELEEVISLHVPPTSIKHRFVHFLKSHIPHLTSNASHC